MTNFEVKQKVKIRNDWLPKAVQSQTATILTFQQNNGMTFAKVQWADEALADEYGELFPLNELRRA